MKVVVTHVYRHANIDELRARLPGVELVVEPDPLAAALEDADAVVCHTLAVADTARAERLRLVQAMSAGADRIEREAVPSGAVLCTVGGHERTMAEWVLMAMLALPRRVLQFDGDLRRGLWRRFGDERIDLGEPELAGKRVCVIGYGQIGRAVAELALAVGADVDAVSRRSVRPLDELEAALTEADFAVVAIALRPETERLIGTRELDALGPSGYLVNVARGAIVDEDALYEALRDGRIAGAALDVWWNYPSGKGEIVLPSRHPYHELDNVLMAPHVSGRSRRTTRLRWQFVADQLERFARGEPLRNVVS